MFAPLLLSALLLCNPVRGAPQSAEPTPMNHSPVTPVTVTAEITPAPTIPPVVAELHRRRSPNPAIFPKDDSDLMKRQACGAYYVTCDTGSCCYLGQECFKNSAGVDSCRYSNVFDYSSLLSSLTAGLYGGGYSYSYDLGLYSSLYSSYLNILTKGYSLPGVGTTTGGYNLPTNTAKSGTSNSNSGSGSGYSSSDTSTSSSGGKKKSNIGMIVGIAVGSVAGVAIVGALVWCCCRRRYEASPPPCLAMASLAMAEGASQFSSQFSTYPQPQPAHAAQAARIDIKPPQAFQFPQQQPPLPVEIGGTGIAPQQQIPPGNAFYAAQGAGYQGPASPPPPTQLSAQEMSGDTQFLPPQQQSQYGPPRNGTPGPLVEMDAGQRR
ncbi:hypothetical protein L873DRAFT_1826987 [Choiromyces venosus 120613-1]|uniref:Uncharacterized protein n=1 Tax=Choiromyces venosus 120613-1 TaxID=1336337 RepID=A0A3N4JY85_9PEZI|nr:hypothetical protein L873DRAFT_1826987 [Choiromyces venosus 120613-1]